MYFPIFTCPKCPKPANDTLWLRLVVLFLPSLLSLLVPQPVNVPMDKEVRRVITLPPLSRSALFPPWLYHQNPPSYLQWKCPHLWRRKHRSSSPTKKILGFWNPNEMPEKHYTEMFLFLKKLCPCKIQQLQLTLIKIC